MTKTTAAILFILAASLSFAQERPPIAIQSNTLYVGADGKFEIKNIPAGQNEFQFWHEAQGYLKNLKFNGGMTDARSGRAKLTIPAGQTLDLGDIKVKASALVPR